MKTEKDPVSHILQAKHTIIIGIDTGVNTGICVYERRKKVFFSLQSTMIHLAINLVTNYCQLDSSHVFVRVEDARLRKWIPRQKNEKAERGRAAGAGSVKRDAGIWEDFLIDMRIDHQMVAPKNNKTKMDSVMFKRITGWDKTTNEHSRDAAMLVFNL